jgi:UDP-N-acetylglucosamine 3-dehydrogenase
MKKVRIGMIGAGVHATNMLYASLEHLNERIEKVAVCDLKEDRARANAKQFGFDKVYTDYRQMIAKEQLDGVIVCLNAKLHPPTVLDCLKGGVDVLVEKPISITVEEAREIEETAEKYNRIVMVEHQKRYSKAYLKAMDLVKQPDFGDIVMIETKMHGRPYETLTNLFLEWHIHNIDIVRAFGGDVKTVQAVQKGIATNRVAIAILLEFENGAVATLNWGSEGGFGRFSERLEVVGSQWRGVIVENARDVTYYDHNRTDYYSHNTAKVWKHDWWPMHENFTHALDGYVGIIQRFAECIETREVGVPSATDERKALEVIHEIFKQLNIPVDWRYVSSAF